MLKTIGNSYTYSSDDWLGTGSFATVYKGYQTHTKQPVAIKEINLARLQRYPNCDHLLRNLSSEIHTMQMLHHPNIVQLLDVIHEHNILYMVMEYCNGGDLVAHLWTQTHGLCGTTGLNELETHPIAVQLAEAIKYMHSMGVVHRDLKPHNILLHREREGDTHFQIKVGDFGFATILTTHMMETMCGSPLYMAPEILRVEKYTSSADLWSYGIILYELLVGRSPFKAKNLFELTNLHHQLAQIHLPNKIFVTRDCRELIGALLIINPHKRLPWDHFINHPWLTRQTVTEQICIPRVPTASSIVFGSVPNMCLSTHNHVQFEQMANSPLTTIAETETLLLSSNAETVPTSVTVPVPFSVKELEYDLTERELTDQLQHWLEVVTQLRDLGILRQSFSYAYDAHCLFQHGLRVCQVIADMIRKHFKEMKDIELNDLTQINKIIYLVEHIVVTMIQQVNTLTVSLTQLAEKVATTIGKEINCKPLHILLYDLALSLQHQAEMEIIIEQPNTAKQHFTTSICLLESLLMFAQPDIKKNLLDQVAIMKHSKISL